MRRNGELALDRWRIFTGPEPIRFTQIGPDPESVPRSVRSLITGQLIYNFSLIYSQTITPLDDKNGDLL